jgi:hypothetical protein
MRMQIGRQRWDEGLLAGSTGSALEQGGLDRTFPSLQIE